MNFYIGVTDTDWFEYLAGINPDEVNFWNLESRDFRAINIGELFLLKNKYPDNAIVGGGYYFKNFKIPMSLAWMSFNNKNGTSSYKEFSDKIYKFHGTNHKEDPDPMVSCNILVAPFFFIKEDWIPAPSDWNPSVPQGKIYDTNRKVGRKIYNQVQEKLEKYNKENLQLMDRDDKFLQSNPSLILSSLGQGSFNLLVNEGYNRMCALSGEKALPLLKPSHIKPLSQQGPNSLNNGILLRSDLHRLFNMGYISITDSYRVLVSRRIIEEIDKGEDYYRMKDQELRMLATRLDRRPKKEYIDWHNENIYLGD